MGKFVIQRRHFKMRAEKNLHQHPRKKMVFEVRKETFESKTKREKLFVYDEQEI